VYGIFKDRAGKLFYVCNGEAIFQFDGQRFVPFELTRWVLDDYPVKRSTLN
jgi:hypothetical protein